MIMILIMIMIIIIIIVIIIKQTWSRQVSTFISWKFNIEPQQQVFHTWSGDVSASCQLSRRIWSVSTASLFFLSSVLPLLCLYRGFGSLLNRKSTVISNVPEKMSTIDDIVPQGICGLYT